MIIISDETWIYSLNPDTKQSSLEEPAPPKAEGRSAAQQEPDHFV